MIAMIALYVALLVAAIGFAILAYEQEFKTPIPLVAILWILTLAVSLHLAQWYQPVFLNH